LLFDYFSDSLNRSVYAQTRKAGLTPPYEGSGYETAGTLRESLAF
jgi:hypothetical protein